MPKHSNMENAEHTEHQHQEHDESGSKSVLPVLLVILLAGMVIVNQYMINGITAAALGTGSNTNAAPTGLISSSPNNAASGPKNTGNGVLPTGVPAVYGKELSVSFDSVSASNPQLADATIRKLGSYDTSITLSGDKMKRYIAIGSQISCEYCCGAKSIIFPDGSAACGCAHSYAMRGLAKYLLQNHADQYTDDQILEELGKWKTLFFPGKLTAKAEVLKQKGIELNYINLASNKYRGIEQGASASGGGMVGGC